jgi:hypothetical protein
VCSGTALAFYNLKKIMFEYLSFSVHIILPSFMLSGIYCEKEHSYQKELSLTVNKIDAQYFNGLIK